MIENDDENEVSEVNEVSTPVPVDMRSNRLAAHRRKAKNYVAKGLKAVLQKTLSNFQQLKFETAAQLYYQASLSFRLASNWRDAGDSLAMCAFLHHTRLKLRMEAGALYTEAAEIFLKIDKADAIKNFLSAVSIYCDIGMFDVAGILQRRIAVIHASHRHWEEAADAYHKASDFLVSNSEQSDYCLEKCAECLIEDERFGEASEIYLILAESCAMTNLRYFNTRQKLLRSLLCSAAETWDYNEEYEYKAGDDASTSKNNTTTDNGKHFGFELHSQSSMSDFKDRGGPRQPSAKYETIRSLIIQYESVDCTWKCSKEALFMRNIVDARQNFNQDEFADHVYYWNSARPLQKIDIVLLNVINKEIQNELDRRAEAARQADLVLNRRSRIQSRLKKKRQNMIERGLDPSTITEADIDIENEDGEEHRQSDGVKSETGKTSSTGAPGSHGASPTGDNQDAKEEEEEESNDSNMESDDDIELPPELREKTPEPTRRKREKKKK